MFQINWKIKSLFYKLFEVFKLKSSFYFIQKYITRRSKVNIFAIDKSWKFHLDAINENNLKNLLELGAGKSLEQNIFLSYILNNKLNQTVIDINNMLDLDLFNEANFQISRLLNKDKITSAKNLSDLEKNFNIIYKAPINLGDLIKGKNTFDICINTTALEHFTIDDLNYTFENLNKLIINRGFVSSAIDYSDHYSHTDKNISSLNFLKFSNENWKYYNNKYLYQNRLRHFDYKKIFLDHGFLIKKIIEGPKEYPKGDISTDFNASREETYITWGYYLIQNK